MSMILLVTMVVEPYRIIIVIGKAEVVMAVMVVVEVTVVIVLMISQERS